MLVRLGNAARQLTGRARGEELDITGVEVDSFALEHAGHRDNGGEE